MYAVIRTGGKQYRVNQNDLLKIEKVTEAKGETIDFEVLAVGEGADLKVGTPLVVGAKVSGLIVRHARSRKILIGKFKRRKKYRCKNGHRQHFTEVRITSIVG